MTNLKKSKINEIMKVFKESNYFTIDDFKFEFPSSGNTLCKIEFISYDDYQFILEEKNHQIKSVSSFPFSNTNYIEEKSLYITQSPGSYKKEDNTKVNDFYAVASSIRDWIGRIDTELEENSNLFDFDNISELIESELNKNISDKNERFNPEEINLMIEKLNKLEDKINKLENKISKKDSEKIYSVIEDSKNNLTK